MNKILKELQAMQRVQLDIAQMYEMLGYQERPKKLLPLEVKKHGKSK
jgi:hypothetical protein